MARKTRVLVPPAGALLIMLLAPRGGADEGMYTFHAPPLKELKAKYGFAPDAAWLEHVMRAAVRFNNGGSGSFVSGNGLVMTNHHVGLDCIQKISTGAKDYVKEGYVAAGPADEVRCPDLELNVLESFEDVTAAVAKAAAGAADDAQAGKLRKAETAAIEKQCGEATGLRCNVVTLYGGGQYMLYRYRRHTDVRLVFAPEQQIAFYGGDPDNFTFPRFDYDISLFRVYEKDAPYRPAHFFSWSDKGAADGELVFVAGHPGTTGRQLTVAQLEFQRDVRTPNRLRSFAAVIAALKAYGAKGDENARQAKEQVFSYENAQKAYRGIADGFAAGGLMEKKKKEEEDFVQRAQKLPAVWAEVKDSWARIAKAQEALAQFHVAQYVAESTVGRTELLRRAVAIVQLVAEKKKPNGERLEEYRDSALESLALDLYSDAPVYKGLEKTLLVACLEDGIAVLGKDDPFVAAALAGKTPEALAEEAVEGTKLLEPEERRKLVKEGEKLDAKKWAKKIAKSKDPMVRLALRVDPVLRALRKRWEDTVKSVEETEGMKLAKARFAVYGADIPPDATFTLRLAFGVVKGYEAEGTVVPPVTNFYGLYGRSAAFGGKPPFDLPPRWVAKKGALDLSVPLNFASTADIVGGNSGSPVLNAKGEVVGLIFDGNIESLVLRYLYTEEKARAVAVHSAGIKEALLEVYEAPAIAAELGAPAAK